MSKVVLITGASSGLGQAIATYLAGKGYIVYGTSRSGGAGNGFKQLVMDVCDTASVQKAVEQILQEQGRIDAVINNAGLGIAGAAEHLSIDDVERVFNTNLFGVMRVCQAVLPSMRKNGKGTIINISSIGSEMGLPYRGAYSASKAALDRFSEAMRIEVKKYGIKVCTVQPGGVNTDINRNRVMSQLPSDSPYKESFNRTYEIINNSVSSGLPAESFGPVIEEIINSDKVKRNYRVGKFKEKLSLFVRSIVPSDTFDNILIKHFKI